MAECAREQLLALYFKFLAEAILSLYLYIVGALYNAPLSGERQAALAALLFAAVGDDFWVYKLNYLILLRACVDNRRSAQNTHLRGSQAHAVGSVHGLSHIVEQSVELIIKFYDLSAFFR